MNLACNPFGLDSPHTKQLSDHGSGRFFRRFTLPESADAENITARCTNGILEISIPKQPEVQARRIKVEVA